MTTSPNKYSLQHQSIQGMLEGNIRKKKYGPEAWSTTGAWTEMSGGWSTGVWAMLCIWLWTCPFVLVSCAGLSWLHTFSFLVHVKLCYRIVSYKWSHWLVKSAPGSFVCLSMMSPSWPTESVIWNYSQHTMFIVTLHYIEIFNVA